MKLPITKLFLLAILSLLSCRANAQIAASNPLEWAALVEGNEIINAQIDINRFLSVTFLNHTTRLNTLHALSAKVT